MSRSCAAAAWATSSPPDGNHEERRALIRLEFVGAGPVAPTGLSRLPGTHNYFLGSHPERWRSGVPAFADLRWEDAWPGIDVRLHAGRDGAFLEYDLECSP